MTCRWVCCTMPRCFFSPLLARPPMSPSKRMALQLLYGLCNEAPTSRPDSHRFSLALVMELVLQRRSHNNHIWFLSFFFGVFRCNLCTPISQQLACSDSTVVTLHVNPTNKSCNNP